MDIKTSPPGWELFQPFPEKFPEVKCEIKRLTVQEGLEFRRDCRDGAMLMPGKEGMVWDWLGESSRRWFFQCVRNIKGVTVNGEAKTRPQELLDNSIGDNNTIASLIFEIMAEFVNRNIVTEDEVKNSSTTRSSSSE